MDTNDKVNNPTRTLARSILIIVWWVCIWGLTDFIIHHMARKNPFRKIAFYIGLMAIVLGCVGLDPTMLNYM
jgi:hypothetical protein